MPVALLDVHRGHRVGENRGAKARAERVEHRRLDADVRREAADEDVLDVGLAQQLGEVCAVEARVGVGVLGRRLLDERTVERGDRRVQLGAVRAGDAVLGPGAALLGERAVVGGVRVARLDDHPGRLRGADERLDDGVAAGHRECAAGQEVVLDVDCDEGRLGHRDRASFWIFG
ncbi:MAG TPA: hypothetical protein VGV67_03970 [Solirubrobacteraceae bacterium]|nr:hypothetical protein [Solirubrobacteraceae bacterium]